MPRPDVTLLLKFTSVERPPLSLQPLAFLRPPTFRRPVLRVLCLYARGLPTFTRGLEDSIVVEKIFRFRHGFVFYLDTSIMHFLSVANALERPGLHHHTITTRDGKGCIGKDQTVLLSLLPRCLSLMRVDTVRCLLLCNASSCCNAPMSHLWQTSLKRQRVYLSRS